MGTLVRQAGPASHKCAPAVPWEVKQVVRSLAAHLWFCDDNQAHTDEEPTDGAPIVHGPTRSMLGLGIAS